MTDGCGKLEKYELKIGETTVRKSVDSIEKRDSKYCGSEIPMIQRNGVQNCQRRFQRCKE
ncbi:hypothetical protein BDZ91DRAFT_719186 [Kalaharituber pfeilii]|nr:hypothetical protein BDZ91DRAFT_719186 [Kalaharituber pfeilii]